MMNKRDLVIRIAPLVKVRIIDAQWLL